MATRIFCGGIVTELMARGHQVTVMEPEEGDVIQ